MLTDCIESFHTVHVAVPFWRLLDLEAYSWKLVVELAYMGSGNTPDQSRWPHVTGIPPRVGSVLWLAGGCSL